MGAAPPAAAAAAAERARRPARGVPAAGAGAHGRARAEGPGDVRRRHAARRAVLRDGARARRRPQRRAAGRRCGRRGSARSSSTRWSRSTPPTGSAAGLEGFGKPTGYLERQLRRFSGLWEHNTTREIAALDEVTRWLGRAPPGVRPGHDRARRLPARERDVHRRAPERDLRLGAGHDRRPAGRHRLPARHLGAARRPRQHGRVADHGHAQARLPHPRGARRPLRGPLRAAR